VCEARSDAVCRGVRKLAFFVDDSAEVTIDPHQTGKSIRELFGLADTAILVRDYESPHDKEIKISDPAPFENGPVFYTRRVHVQLTVIVNNKRFTEAEGVKRRMTGRQIAALVSDNPDATEVFKLTKCTPEPVPLNKEIEIENCDEFRVVRNNVAG